MSHPNESWKHRRFQLMINGHTYMPYMAIEGVWRVQETIPGDGPRPEAEHLHDLIELLHELDR